MEDFNANKKVDLIGNSLCRPGASLKGSFT